MVGSSCVNAISKYFEAKIMAGGKLYQIIFENGHFKQRQQAIKNIPAKNHGTMIKYKLDNSFFPEDKLDVQAAVKRCQQTAFLNPRLQFVVSTDIDVAEGEPVKEYSFCYEHGLKDYLELLTETKNVSIPSKIFLNKVVNDTKLGRPLTVDVAFTYIDSYTEDLRGFVNSIYSEEGGSHVVGFNAGICAAIRQYALENKKIKNFNDLETTDVEEGILGIVSIKIKKPTYNQQNKRKLDMPQIRTIIASTIKDEFYNFLSKNPKEAEVILGKALRAREERIRIKRARDAARGLKEINTKSVTIGKLADCRTKNPEEAEIFVVEGDSAGGSAKQARDSKFQAILPIFGKVLNTEKKRVDEVVNNEKLGLLLAALKCGIGDDFDINKLRYHKIILFSDADYIHI